MADLNGSPKLQFDVNAAQIPPLISSTGIGILQGPTNRGKINTPIFCNNALEFLRQCGGELVDSKFPIYVRRLLESGIKLWILRAGHYTDPTDKSTLVGTKATATITISSNNSVWRATDIGPGYNGTTIIITAASSGDATKKDITIKMKDSDVSIAMKEVSRTMNAAAIADFNLALIGAGTQVELVSIATQIENGTGTLASGVQDVTAIVAADYTGNASQGNGWFAADTITNSMRIANLGLVGDEDVDDGLRAYVHLRGDMRYYIGTPLGVNDVGMLAYRNGTSPYSNGATNEWLGSLIAGDVNITDFTNKNKSYNIPGVVDVFGRRLLTDAKKPTQDGGQWRSHAGPKNGKVTNPNNGVPYNLGSPSLSGNYDAIYPKGVNAIVEDADFGTVYWGNKTLWTDQNSLLNHENIADSIIYMIRTLKPDVRFEMFDPNDVSMWRAMYKRVYNSLKSFETNRIIVPGEGSNWFWQGDQDVDKREDATFNVLSELDLGKYRVRFVFIPIAATEYIGIEMVPTDSNSVKFVVTQF